MRTLLRVVLGTLTLVALGVVAVLVSGALREKLLVVGLQAGTRSLPGTVTVGDVRWPKLGHLRLTDLVWREGEEQSEVVAQVALLDCRLDLGALRSRDVRVDSLRVVMPWLDGPAIGRLMRTRTEAQRDTVTAGSSASPAFPRSGVIPEWPSIAVNWWRLDLADIVVTDRMTVSEVSGVGSLEAGYGRPGHVVVDHLELNLKTDSGDSLSSRPARLSLRHLGAGLSLGDDPGSDDAGPTAARFQATLDSLTVQLDVSGLLAGATTDDKTAREGSLAMVRLHQTGHLSRAEGVLQGELISDFDLPFMREWRAGLPAGIDDARFDRIVGRNALTGSYQDSWLDLKVDLDLEPTTWLQAGRLQAQAGAPPDRWAARDWRTTAVTLDALDLALMGTRLQAGGSLQQGRLDLDLDLNASNTGLASLIRPDLVADAKAALDLHAHVGGTLQAPTLALNLEGELEARQARIPRMSLRADADLRGGDLELDLPEGLALAAVTLDSLAARVQFNRAGNDTLTGNFSIAARRGTDRVTFGGFARSDSLGRLQGSSARLDSVIVSARGRELRIDNELWLSRAGDGYRGNYAADFVLPGAADLKNFLPADFPHDDFGPVVGRLAVAGVYQPPQLDLNLDLDLQPTAWLDAGRLSLSCGGEPAELAVGRFAGATIELDTLTLALPGHDLQAHGALQSDNLSLTLHAAVTEPWLAAILRPEIEPDSELAVDLGAQLGGTLERPSLQMMLEAGIKTPLLSAPEISLQIAGDATGAEASLQLPGGIIAADVALDSLTVHAQATRAGADSLTGTFAFGARRQSERLSCGGAIWSQMPGRVAGKRVRLDSLVIGSAGRRMRLSEPATIDLGPGPLDLALTPVVFTGDAGEVRLNGRADTTGFDLSSRLELVFSGGLMDRIAPSEVWSALGGTDLALNATADLKGTQELPQLGGRMGARLVPRNGDPDLGVDVDFALTARDSAGLRADLALVAADSVLLGGRFFLPGTIEARTGQWRHGPDQAARVVIPDQTLKTALLSRFLPSEVAVSGLVTVGADIAVPLSAALTDTTAAAGRQSPGKVSGHLRGKHLEVNLPNRSRMVLNTDLQLAGDFGAPRLGGKVIVESGFLRIPEIQRNLHPITGKPLLWELAIADTANVGAGQPPVFVPAAETGPSVSEARATVLPDLALDVLIPGNLRVYGYGLDIELSGDLKVSRGYDADGLPHPRMHGTIQAVQGTLRFMNRSFTVERCEVRFRGAVPADPELDMSLVANVSGTVVRILVTGSATDPVITLTSEPDYEESDIMAVLLFGQPLNELDTEERGSVGNEAGAGQQLRQNLAGLAVVFGTAGLQNQISSSVGVDMVEVGSDSQGGSTLMVGKFINPRLMLKYHHSLEKSGTYFLTMEYALSQVFKVVSTYGQGEEDSGLELKWTRRY